MKYLRPIWKLKATKQSRILVSCTDGGDVWLLQFKSMDPRLYDLEELRRKAVSERRRGSRRLVSHYLTISKEAAESLGLFFRGIHMHTREANRYYERLRSIWSKGDVAWGGL